MTSLGPDYEWKPAEVRSLVQRAKVAAPGITALLNDLVKEHEVAIEMLEKRDDLLRRIRQWDMLDSSSDGPFWKSEIDRVMRS